MEFTIKNIQVQCDNCKKIWIITKWAEFVKNEKITTNCNCLNVHILNPNLRR